MELTLDQALKNGCTQEEEMFYSTLQTILEAHPAHPDANYHMGLLAVDANKISEALSFFKTALEMNPRMGQFWLSYIDTLIKLDRITEAKFMFDQAKDQGAIGVLFDQLEKQLSDSSVYPQALLPDKLDPIESLYIQDQQDQASPKILETLFDVRRWYSYTLFLKELTANSQANCWFFVKWRPLIMFGSTLDFDSGNGLKIVPLTSLVSSLKGMGFSILLLKIAQKILIPNYAMESLSNT